MTPATDEQSSNPRGITREAVQILRHYTGREPTEASTAVGHDTVTILMGDTLTQQERSLVEGGNVETVMSLRHGVQEAMRVALVAMVEARTERKVIAFMSQNHIDPDLAVEVFVLQSAAAA